MVKHTQFVNIPKHIEKISTAMEKNSSLTEYGQCVGGWLRLLE